MTRLYRSTVPALLLLVWPLVVVAQQPPSVSGRIRDARGAPIEGAAVELIEPGQLGWTDALGVFRLRLSGEGEFTLRVSRIGWVTRTQRVQVHTGSDTRVDLTLLEQPVPLPALTVAARAANALRIERSELQRSGARSAADALARLPGVVISSPNPGGAQLISVRGSAHDQVLVLVDGVASNDPITGAADLSRISAALIESMTLLVGAQSAEYGGRALAGVVLIETRRAGALPELDLRAGSLGLLQGAATLGGGGGVSWSAGANWQQLDGRFDFALPAELGSARLRRQNADARALDAFGAVSAQFAAGSLRTRFGWQSEERGLPGRSYAPAPAARQETQETRGSLNWETLRPAQSLRLSAGWVQQRNSYRDTVPPLGLPYDDSVLVSAAEAHAQWERRFERTSVSLGLDARVQHITTGTLESGFRQPAQLGVSAHGTRVARIRGLNTGLNVQLRLDHDRTQQRQFLSHSVTLSGGNDRLVAHLAQRTGYAPPALGDQFFRESVGVRPNPGLRAERAQELEAGARYDAQLGSLDLSASVSAFTGRIRDLIIWAPDYRFIWSPQNHDALRSGVELSASATLGASWRSSAGFNITRITYDRPGDSDDDIQVVYRPRYSGAFTVERLTRHWDLRLEANHHGQRNTAPTSLNALPAFWTSAAGLNARFQLWQVPAGLQLRVDRLLDEEGALIFGFPQPGRTFTTTLRLGGSSHTPESERLP